MGVDYFVCRNCGDTFPDCGDYVSCEGCGEHWCSHECAVEDGYMPEHCSAHPELEDRDMMEKYRGEHCGHGDCSFCDNYVAESCGYCRGEKFDESFLLEKAIELLGIDEETFLKIVVSEQKGDDNWINRYRNCHPFSHIDIGFMIRNCPHHFFEDKFAENNLCECPSIKECVMCWHRPCEEITK